MRYTLDSSGFVFAVAFGSYLDNCREYTGEIPAGYRTLYEWATYACIQAYYIDSNGNLVLDSERLEELEKKQAQEAIDNAPLVRKDLYEFNEVLDSQYARKVASGKVIVLEDIKSVAPKVKLTNVQPYEYDKITVYTQGRNMLPCIAKTETIEGVKFTKNANGSLSVVGTALQNIEYVVAESFDTIFSLKANENYYLNLGGLNCELRFVDNGEIAQQYVGKSGLINVPKHIEVSQVVIKFAKGESANTTFYPQLEYGNKFTGYAEHKCKTFEVDISEIITRYLVPSDTLFPSDTLLLKEVTKVDYILIEDNAINVSANGLEKRFTGGAFGLFTSYSTIYATKDIDIEIEYSANMMAVDDLEFLQGKSTTTNKFKILNDGSIEAHNGYFSGRIEADSGYFKGEISWDQITGNDDVATKPYVEGLGYQNASQVTKITKDTITTSYIKALNLKVGNEIQMGDNAKISWANVTNQPNIPTDTGQLTNGAGYQNANQVTNITKNTVTTAYVNALNVTAGSVKAENITGTTISGKKLEGGSISIGNKSSFSSTSNGVYIGNEGISAGGKYGIQISSNGDIDIKSNGSIEFEFGSTKMQLDYEGIRFGTTSWNTEINKDKVQVYHTYMDREGITVQASTYNAQCKIEYDNIYLDGYSLDYLKLTTKDLSFYSGDTFNMKSGDTTLMSLSAGNVTLFPSLLMLGGGSSYLGFFNANKSAKQQKVSTISSPSGANASTCATKINELINALKAYNLIG